MQYLKLNPANHCWICLSIFLPRGWALPISTDKWTHISTSLYHTYGGESLFISYMCYLYSTDRIHNPDKILNSLLTDLTSTHKEPARGGPTISDVRLQQQAPFCFSRQNSINNSYPQLGTMPLHLCNYTSHLPFRWSVCNISGTAGHSLTFLGRLPSTCGVNTPLVGATRWVHRQSQKLLTSCQKDSYLLLMSAVVFLLLEYFCCVELPPTYVFPLIGQEDAPWYI